MTIRGGLDTRDSPSRLESLVTLLCTEILAYSWIAPMGIHWMVNRVEKTHVYWVYWGVLISAHLFSSLGLCWWHRSWTTATTRRHRSTAGHNTGSLAVVGTSMGSIAYSGGFLFFYLLAGARQDLAWLVAADAFLVPLSVTLLLSARIYSNIASMDLDEPLAFARIQVVEQGKQ